MFLVSPKDEGLLAQIKTVEGKTTIVVKLAVIIYRDTSSFEGDLIISLFGKDESESSKERRQQCLIIDNVDNIYR